jgi:hypothetical protein
MPSNTNHTTPIPVRDFIAAIAHPTRRQDAEALDALFQDITGWTPRMSGSSIVGYGQYHYVYDSGREGDCIATGFSPRKSSLSIYIMPGYADFSEILSRLGKHKIGKACLYVNKLADIDMSVLRELIVAGLKDLNAKYPVRSS